MPRIITNRGGYILDSYTVIEDSGQPISGRERIKEILQTLRRELNRPDARPAESSRRTPRVLKYFHTPTQVTFTDDEINERTVYGINHFGPAWFIMSYRSRLHGMRNPFTKRQNHNDRCSR